MVENLVAIELAYINTKHPDFYKEIAMVPTMIKSGDGSRSQRPKSVFGKYPTEQQELVSKTRSSSNPHLNSEDATTWVTNLTGVPNGRENDINHVNNLPDSAKSDGELRNVLSPQKPVNLLPLPYLKDVCSLLRYLSTTNESEDIPDIPVNEITAVTLD